VGRLSAFLGITVVLCLTASCTLGEQRKARAGLDASVAQLPKLREFDTIKVIYYESSLSGPRTTCYYATAYTIIGTSLPELKALDVYVEELKSLGWRPREKQYDTTRILMRGTYELVVVRSGEPGVDVKDAVDYAQLRAVYPTIIFVRLDFMLPNRDKC
jgi:hypothetical protein